MKKLAVTLLIGLAACSCFGQGNPILPYITIDWRDILGVDPIDPTFAGLNITNCADLASNSAVFQPNADSTTYFQVKDAAGTNIFNVDSDNEYVHIGATPVATFPRRVNVYDNGVDGLARIALHGTSGMSAPPSVEFTIDGAGTKRVLMRLEEEGSNDYGFSLYTTDNLNIAEHFRVYGSGLVRAYQNTSEVGLNAGLQVEQDGTGDAVVQYLLTGVRRWVTGIDNSDSDSFKIASTVDLASNSWFTLTTSGFLGLGGETAPETMVEMTGTAPYLTLHNSTHEDADGGRESLIQCFGEQSGGEETTLAKILVQHDGAADDEKGELLIYTNDGSDGDSPTLRMSIDSAGATDVVGAFTAGTVRSDDGVSGTLELDDGTTEKITLVFTGGILTSRTVAATTGSVLADWTD